MTRRMLRLLLLALILFEPSGAAASQDLACTPPAHVDSQEAAAWLVFTGEPCFMKTCTGTSCPQVDAARKDRAKAADALRAIRSEGAAFQHDRRLFEQDRRKLLARVDHALDQLAVMEQAYAMLAAQLRPERPEDREPYQVSPALVPDTWVRSELVLFEGEAGAIDLGGYFVACSDACGGELAAAADLLRITTLVRHTLGDLVRPWHEGFVARVNSVVAQWKQFADANRGQTPWELLLNGRVFSISRDFAPPPATQMLLLHPEPAGWLRVSEGRQLSPRLAVSLVGLRSWRWRDDAEAVNAVEPVPVSLRYGFSALAVLGSESEPAVTWGFNVHVRQGIWVGYTTGMSQGSRQHFVVVSGDTMRIFGSRTRVLQRFIQK